MRIVVAGAGFANKGAEAMTRTLRTELGGRVPGIELLFWDCPPSQADVARTAGLQPLMRPALDGRARKLAWALRRVATHGGLKAEHLASPVSMWSDASAATMLDTAGTFDAFVDISGFAYGDTWGAGVMRAVMPVVTRARERSLPVVFMPQAWGPFDRPEVRNALAELAGGPRTLVFSRDPRSTGHLEAAGLPEGTVATRSDIVFAFEGGTEARGRELLGAMGAAPGRTLVGIAPNMRVYERSDGEGAANEHVRSLVALVRHCVDRLGAQVVLLPSECAPMDRGADDRRLCAMVRAEADRESRCHTSAAYVSADDARALIGRCDYLVASRFHALVFALSQGVPGSALGWSHKYRELMAQFDAEVDCLEHGRAGEQDVIDLFESGWARREEKRARSLAVAAELKADVHALFDEVAAFLIRGGSS